PLGRCAAAEVAAEHVKAIAHEFFGQAAGRQDAIQARLALLLIALHRHGIAAIAPPVRRDRASDIVDRFRRLVDEEFRSRRPIAVYAERLGVTHTHLSRLCRQVLNDTALGVLNRRIVLEATRLLTFTALDVKEVAAALGFDDPAYFARFFRRETGRTPSEFRAGRSAADQ
ncbi:MAG TPA: helix-turn-helix domain-containing protein, partial [Alphaproteobacteria bacterium]|nr:helix-turn-helix domain-containing protein [Alphaproteobacteria bacterium]